MTSDKKPNKNDRSKKGKVTCERTYVAEKCSRSVDQHTRQPSPSPAKTLRISDLPGRHKRKGAVRDKRNVSLDKCRPARQRADNAYAVDVVPLQRQATQCSSSAPNIASCGSADGGDLPAMRSSAEPPPRPGEGIIDEFPAYVPWKAEQSVFDDPFVCYQCIKCRCNGCQKLCKFPGMRVCGRMDMNSHCDEACVEAITVCIPCIRKTARCSVSNASRAEVAAAAAARAEAEEAAAAAARTEAENAAIAAAAAEAEAEAAAAAGKCRLRWLLCCVWMRPSCTLVGPAECSRGCRGNVNVSKCECVDWDALRRNNRRRVNAAATAVAAARDLRRCRDNLYYITALPHLAHNVTEPSADNATSKLSKLRKFLRF